MYNRDRAASLTLFFFLLYDFNAKCEVITRNSEKKICFLYPKLKMRQITVTLDMNIQNTEQ